MDVVNAFWFMLCIISILIIHIHMTAPLSFDARFEITMNLDQVCIYTTNPPLSVTTGTCPLQPRSRIKAGSAELSN